MLGVKPVLAALLGDLALSRLRSKLTPTATIACRGAPEQAFSGITRRADEPGQRGGRGQDLTIEPRPLALPCTTRRLFVGARPA